MKYILVIGDGMSDRPLEELGGRTPLQVAVHPNMDEIASEGACGTLATLPPGTDTGTDTAVMSILGYDPRRFHAGRGPLEAANMGVQLGPNDLAFRCNLITVKDRRIIDHSAGHITSQEGAVLIASLQKEFEKRGKIEFYAGVSFRHLLVLRGARFSDEIMCTPPHDSIGRCIDEIIVSTKSEAGTETAALLNSMILRSERILSGEAVNLERARKGVNAANFMWVWSPGRRPAMPSFYDRCRKKAAVISAVDLVNGIGYYAGMKRIIVPGATGYADTNYEGKADCAVKALEEHDVVIVHVEAPDEAAHIGDFKLKVRTIEDLDRRLIGRIIRGISGEYTIGVLPDHATPTNLRTHVRDPVPFAIHSTKVRPSQQFRRYDEETARRSNIRIDVGHAFIDFFFNFR